MPAFWIDIENTAGVLQGDGPIVTAESWTSIQRLDRAGSFWFSVPASDPRAANLGEKYRAGCKTVRNSTVVEVGKGVINNISYRITPGGVAMLDVSGDDLLDLLTDRQVINITTGENLVIDDGSDGPTRDGLGNSNSRQILYYADDNGDGTPDWSLDTTNGYGTTGTALYMAFENGETVLEALNRVAEALREHFRLGSGKQIVWLREDVRNPDSFKHHDDPAGANTFTDLAEALDGNVNTSVTRTVTSDDYLYIGDDAKFDGLRYNLTTGNANAATLTWEYWNGSVWLALTVSSDATIVAGKPLAQDGDVAFTRPADWATTSVNGATRYWVRIRPSANLSPVEFVELSVIQSAWSPSGVRAVAQGESIALDGNADVCVITNLVRTRSSDNLITRVRPYATGKNKTITLLQTNRSAPPDGFTWGLSLDPQQNWMQYTAAKDLYGVIVRDVVFPGLGNTEDTTTGDQSNANFFVDVVANFLRRYGQFLDNYTVDVIKLDRAVEVGQTIRVDYDEWWGAYHAVDIHADLVVLEATTTIDNAGVRTTSMVLAPDGIWLPSDLDILVSTFKEVKALSFAAQPVDQTGEKWEEPVYDSAGNLVLTNTRDLVSGRSREQVRLQPYLASTD